MEITKEQHTRNVNWIFCLSNSSFRSLSRSCNLDSAASLAAFCFCISAAVSWVIFSDRRRLLARLIRVLPCTHPLHAHPQNSSFTSTCIHRIVCLLQRLFRGNFVPFELMDKVGGSRLIICDNTPFQLRLSTPRAQAVDLIHAQEVYSSGECL